MLTGIIIGATMIIVISIIGEVRVMKERREQADLHQTIEIKDKEIAKKIAHNQELRASMKELLSSSIELTHDYTIIAKILEDEIGREEAYIRYMAKKNQKPTDLNDLLKTIKKEKGE